MFVLLQERIRVEETQTPAQRQAAAKLALRKQLEKTLLQVSSFRMLCIRKSSSQWEVFMPQHIVSCITDSSSKATPTRDAFHPKPIQHRVYLPAWFGARCGLHNQGSEDSASTWCIQMLAVPNGLYACMEVGEESNKRWALWWGNKKHMCPEFFKIKSKVSTWNIN